MALLYANVLRTQYLDEINGKIGASPKFIFYDGVPPAQADDAIVTSRLAEGQAPITLFTPAMNLTISLNGPVTGAAIADGTITFFRITDQNEIQSWFQGTCGPIGSGADLEANSVVVVNGQPLAFSAFSITWTNP